MSRFAELNDSLRREEEAKTARKDELKRKVTEAKQRYFPYIQRANSVLGDYYTEILSPKGYTIIPRKKEGLTPREEENPHYETILFAHAANIVSPRHKQPYQESTSHDDWTSPTIRELDAHSWHPNVALHFLARVVSHDPNMNDIELDISMRVWGFIETDATSLTQQGVSISTGDGGWSHYATSIFIRPHPSLLESQVESALKVVTPNTLYHKEIFDKTFF